MMIPTIILSLFIAGVAAVLGLLWKNRSPQSWQNLVLAPTRHLFQELCNQYGLARPEVQYLEWLAENQELRDPCELFIEAEHWGSVLNTPTSGPISRSSQTDALSIFNKLFQGAPHGLNSRYKDSVALNCSNEKKDASCHVG